MRYKKVITYLFALLLFFFLIEKGFDFAISKNKNIKINYFTSNTVNASILFDGSCVMLNTVSPKFIKNRTGFEVYNIAQNHADFAENYLNLLMYIKNNVAPKYVFLFTSPESFDKRFNTLNSYRFVSFMKEREINETIKDLDYSYWFYSHLPFGKYAYYNSSLIFPTLQGFKHFLYKQKTPYFKDGYEPLFQVWKVSKKQFKESYSRNFKFEVDSNRINYFKKYIGLCKTNKIDLVLIETPMYKGKSKTNRLKIIHEIDKIAIENNLQFIRFDSLKMCKKQANFMTSFELQQNSAKKFNLILGEFIYNKLIKNGINKDL